MHRNVLISILLGAIFCLTASAMPLDKIHPALRAKMLSADEGEFIPITLKLSEKFDTKGFMERTQHLSKQDRRAQLIEEASAFAADQQQGILAMLNEAKAEGAAEAIRPLWIVNMVTVRVQKNKIESLGAIDQIQKISWNRRFTHEQLHDAVVPPPAGGPGDAIGWGVEKIGAPKVWAMGIEGQGAVLANLDSGTDYNHPDLAGHIWNNADEIPNNGVDDDSNGFVDDTMGWDFENNDKDPMDTYGHGTQTAGVSVGDGTNGTQTGVSPKTDLMILRISGEDDHMAAQQYAIENGADVITSSYSYKWYFSPRPDYHAFRDASVMELAAGLFHNNSSSNSGTSVGVPWNISAPAVCPPPWLHPDQTLIGDVGGTMGIGGTESDDSHYSPSPTGPSTWEDLTYYDPGYPNSQNPAYWDYPYSTDPTGLIKVDVCCPTGVPSTTIGGGYSSSFGGTSAATPHCGGASALIVSANPSLSCAKICQALKTTAVDLGAPGLDVLFGAGRIDIFEAVKKSISTFLADNTNPAIGTDVTLDLKGPANSEYAMIFSFTPGKVMVIPRVLTLDIMPPYLFVQTGYTDGNGEASWSFHVPMNPAHSGLQLYFQSVVDDRAGSTGEYLPSLLETVTIQ